MNNKVEGGSCFHLFIYDGVLTSVNHVESSHICLYSVNTCYTCNIVTENIFMREYQSSAKHVNMGHAHIFSS